MDTLLTWILSYKKFTTAFSEMVDDLKIDVNLSLRNSKLVEETLTSLKSFDLLSTARNFFQAVEIDKEAYEKFLTSATYLVTETNELLKKIEKGVSLAFNKTFLLFGYIIKEIGEGKILELLEVVMSNYPIDLSILYGIIEQLERGDKYGISEKLLQLATSQSQANHIQDQKKLMELLKQKNIPEILEYLKQLKLITEEIKENVVQHLDNVMGFITNKEFMEKIKLFVQPLIPQEENFGKAIESFINKLKPSTNLDVWNLFAQRALKKQNWKGASQCFEKLLEIDPENGESYYQLAYCHIHLNNFEEAKNCINNAIEIMGNVSKYWGMKNLISVYCNPEKNYDKDSDWVRFLELTGKEDEKEKKDEKEKENGNGTEIWFKRGLIYLEENLLSKSEICFQKCQKSDPKNLLFNFYLALVYWNQGDDENVEKLCKLAIDNLDLCDEKDQIYYFLLKGLYSLSLDLNSRAVFEFSELLFRSSSSKFGGMEWIAYILRGTAYEAVKKFNNARSDYQKAFEIRPKNKLIQKSINKIGTENADEFD
ncbi:hypothetical protein M0812_18497 [Anaeramoeba flamelloides]|uniref:Tetratricopeptide repeat protein n=1 Tax=Anaeramoeba flamelloides TaxID=1746091 RepID=A0AAV7Z3Q5_9EUKA|nr:hypothetical protein M0812_18497 [Anaeramoeba flamelloides]|eukprot:Anaeramoba_flamelloidesa85978_269.p1 GENE.a85978_269~~a85978_269.p1  ORF type:complete len:540 (-),score=145.39 a85978_269:95-1714(-)